MAYPNLTSNLRSADDITVDKGFGLMLNRTQGLCEQMIAALRLVEALLGHKRAPFKLQCQQCYEFQKSVSVVLSVQ